jgi:hypothetical protein
VEFRDRNNSFENRLESSRSKRWRAISGGFLGPKTRKAKNRKIVSEKLIRFIVLPQRRRKKEDGNASPRGGRRLCKLILFREVTVNGERFPLRWRPPQPRDRLRTQR